jgi:flagellar biosynthesis/type III secretory pathway M-ring protein FliF/YscJ
MEGNRMETLIVFAVYIITIVILFMLWDKSLDNRLKKESELKKLQSR